MNAFYTERIRAAFEYIRNNLDKKLSLKSVSEATDLPRLHLQRMFYFLTGENIVEAAERLKLERAAEILVSEPGATISELAVLSGYQSKKEFSRAFKSRFSFSPTAWRNGKMKIPVDEPGVVSNKEYIVNLLNAEVNTIDDFYIAYLKYAGAYAGDTALFIYLYNKLTAWAASRDLLAPECENIVVYHDPVSIVPNPRQKISLGISVPEDTKGGRDIGKMKIRGGNYLVCRYNIGEDEDTEAWKHTYRAILPEMNLVPENAPAFELYPAAVKSPDRHKNIVDIYIPVKPAE